MNHDGTIPGTQRQRILSDYLSVYIKSGRYAPPPRPIAVPHYLSLVVCPAQAVNIAVTNKMEQKVKRYIEFIVSVNSKDKKDVRLTN